MNVRNLLLASAIGLSMATPAWSGDLATDAKAFGARESVSAPDLSPDGSSVIYVTPGPGRKSVAVVGNLETGQFHTMVTSDGSPESIGWCHFAAASRAVCQFGGYVPWQGDTGAGDPVWFSRLVAVDLDGSHAKLMGQPESSHDEWIRQTDGQIIDWLDSNGKVLVNRLYMPESNTIGKLVYNKKRGWGLDKIDVASLRAEVVETPRESTSYMTDGQGNVRLMSVVDARSSGVVTGEIRYFYRTTDSKDWKQLFRVTDFERPEAEPLAIDASNNSLYARKKKNGRYALYAIKLDGSLAETLVAENPRVDIDDVIRFGEAQRVIGYTYTDERQKSVYFDTEFNSLAASLSKALPNSPLIDFSDSSRDGRKLLLFAGSDRDPGRYYVFDRDKKALTPAMVARPELEGRTLASVRSVTIPAPDGMSMPAYLTLPPGKGEKGLPAIVLPHGGPESRDRGGFNWLAQFLAARGYAVLQPQFRGSAGFGDAWLNENGFRNWRTSIGDIDASAKWLSSQGIADPNKIAILGWSYGGYAALQTAATDPGIYKAVVAIAPVTDLSLLKTQAQFYSNSRLVDKEIGSGAHVTQGSPVNNAASIAAPVLLIHGTMDANVFYSQSQKMDSALRGAGKQSELLTFKDLDHQLDDSDARAQMLTKIGELLDRTIGH
jgi:dipeptidyl aminopeptidase/acylaminoacyl peptidase